ncbi:MULTISPECIES: hypothetical protein [Sphingomonadales]|uniref:Uncharacterized protein n=2 Tax=Edaphosphingomonas TaxID=3423724 RepID=A0A2T4HPF3_9SPHN|nr:MULTISPECIES: hypothetical protein [Sphingomonas]AGH49085.1 hypothetical protein G432_06800 [Sphingomonas sp. MM-1]MDX3883685.1 hypothetical protein [Sphingomonas sp.]OHT21506.1 hypothetical protein BHE75_03514 [Sphingomonas haloaromaticamans]PTD17689.1 hypothetical protein CV103_17020 [Sphingomonas fennica]
MSRDQQPERVRVVSSGQTTAIPRRRRGDREADDAAAGEIVAATADAVDALIDPPAATGLPTIALALLFILGCGIGGALIGAFGLFEVQP